MIRLAEHKYCTSCGVCAAVCPKSCIRMETTVEGNILPSIDKSACIECHACERICPILEEPVRKTPEKCYASWSLNESERKTSASGGIAAEFYEYAIKLGYHVVGAEFEDDFSVSLKVTNKESDLSSFKNSKYVYSSAGHSYKDARNIIKKGGKILIIGLPCQIAAFRKIFPNNPNVILVEILCHGATSYKFLKQYLDNLQSGLSEKINQISFRDPEYGTKKYVFTARSSTDECLYKGTTSLGDIYQVGYHCGATYKESCYTCKFARRERVGDLVLSDFYGLGKIKHSEYNSENVSCVIPVTPKGVDLYNSLVKEKKIFSEERPLEEAIKGNPRLTHPNIKNKYRKTFEKRIKKYNGDFIIAMRPIVHSYLKKLNAPIWRRRLAGISWRINKFLGRCD